MTAKSRMVLHDSEGANKGDLLELAAYDSLTGLLNWFWFTSKVNNLMGDNKSGAMIFLVVNKFKKQANDLSGHAIGDMMLQKVSIMLSQVLPEKTLISRWSGGEFCVYLHDLSMPHVRLVVANLLNQVDGVRVIGVTGNHQLYVSLGVVYFDKERPDVAELINSAEFAMLQAKKNGLGVTYINYNESDKNECLFVGLNFQEILARNIINLNFQPIVDLATETIASYEALLRFNVDGSHFLPNNFIDYCESSSVIYDLDLWVVQNVIQLINKYDVMVNCNVSALSLNDENTSRKLIMYASALKDPAKLVVEITETSLLNLDEHVCSVVNGLQKMGVKIAIDDFGSGYSSFKTLLMIPVDYLKIDGSLILKLVDDVKVQSYMSALSMMSQNGFNYKLIAEYIEDVQIRDACKKFGIHYGQGFLFGKPCSLTEELNG